MTPMWAVKADDGSVRESGVWFDPRVAGGRQDLLLCKRCGKSVGVCESLRRSEATLQRPPNETRGGRSEGDNRFQRSELDYLIYNDPLAYADLILNSELNVLFE